MKLLVHFLSCRGQPLLRPRTKELRLAAAVQSSPAEWASRSWIIAPIRLYNSCSPFEFPLLDSRIARRSVRAEVVSAVEGGEAGPLDPGGREAWSPSRVAEISLDVAGDWEGPGSL